MTFADFLVQIRSIKFDELRVQTDEYFEAVIAKAGLDPLQKVLVSYFGAPLKPEGHSPSGEAVRLAKPHGGIRKDQTLYSLRQDGNSDCALLWPWGGGSRITLKIIRSKAETGKQCGFFSFLGNLFGNKKSHSTSTAQLQNPAPKTDSSAG